MGLKKEKGKPSQVSRKVIQGKGFDSNDHWAFLEEIDASKWADLTIEAQSMDNALTMLGSGYHIRSIKCRLINTSPSKTGKHYKSRKWLGNVNGSLTAKQHPVRKLMGGKSLDTVTKKSATRNSSTSTVTESFSSRKPLQSSSVLEAHAATETSLSSSVMSKYQNLRPKSSFRGPRKTCNVKRITSQVAGKGSSVARISGKSSVGSSRSSGSIVENVNTTKIQKMECDAKLDCQESESKTLENTAVSHICEVKLTHYS
ncbi:hypothetical protein OPV22_001345 [Ensete ventricosum]|uniref:Uncharacterized protein n=1 Tax=Ensete ventricosum TaxID=4639 RepID=A0AAV8RS46_ENSVE|nr:hypothetical protein OPV22_001345 [Ensete ventricosum]